ncbi:MAG: hypothetical protein V3U44_09025, partial [Alphaproteobacteria bacterium]
SMKLGEAVYKAQQEATVSDVGDAGDVGAGAGPAPDSDDKTEDDATVVDAEFEEVDDEKKDKSA